MIYHFTQRSSVLQYSSPHDVRAAQIRGSGIAIPISSLDPKMWWCGQQHFPAPLPPGKYPVSLVQEVVWAGLDGTKNLPLRRFDFRTVQPASRYSDWVCPATSPVWRRLLKSDTRENNANCPYKICRSVNSYHKEEILLLSKSVIAATFKIRVKVSSLSGLAYSDRGTSECFLSPTWRTTIEPNEPVMKVHLNCLQLVILHPQYPKLRIYQYRWKVKVKWSRYRPGVAQRVGRGIALLFHDRGTRRGWVVSSTPRQHFTPWKYPVPILQEAEWAPGPVWTGRKSRPHWDSIPDCPALSQSLYRLSYPARLPIHTASLNSL